MISNITNWVRSFADSLFADKEKELLYTGEVLKLNSRETTTGLMYQTKAGHHAVNELNSRKAPIYGIIRRDGDDVDIKTRIVDVSHKFEKAWIEDYAIYATIKVLNTPRGQVLRDMIENEIPINLKLTGRGNINSNKEVYAFEFDRIDVKVG